MESGVAILILVGPALFVAYFLYIAATFLVTAVIAHFFKKFPKTLFRIAAISVFCFVFHEVVEYQLGNIGPVPLLPTLEIVTWLTIYVPIAYGLWSYFKGGKVASEVQTLNTFRLRLMVKFGIGSQQQDKSL